MCEDVPAMNFRAVAEEDPLLGKRVFRPGPGYSIRPPGGWAPAPGKPPKSAVERKLKQRLYFRDGPSGDFLDVGILTSAPKEISYSTLSGFRDMYVAAVKKSGAVELIGTDIFRVNGICAVQIITQKSATLFLQLVLFGGREEWAQLTFGLSEARYRERARTIEAVIASFKWNP